MKLRDIEPGTSVRIVGDYGGCIHKGTTVKVQEDEGGKFIPCDEGHHYLEPMKTGKGTIPELKVAS